VTQERDPAIDHPGRSVETEVVTSATVLGVVADKIAAQASLVEVARDIRENTMSDADKQVTVVTSNTPSARARVEVLPPIQIRGLAADVRSVKRGFAEIREIVRDVNGVAAALTQDLSDVKDQLHQHRQDIRFEAEQLGNSGGNGEG
jgi:hypothetical protein